MQGFSVFKRKGRSVWYVKYRDPDSYLWKSVATDFALDEPNSYRRAIRFGEMKAAEFKANGTEHSDHAWVRWVPHFLDERYRNSPLTHKRYTGAWHQLFTYLNEVKVRTPGRLRYTHALGFIDWRTSQKRVHGGTACRNTALDDLRVLSIVMREAIRRGFAMSNPCEKLGVYRDPPKQKEALTPDDIAKIRAAVQKKEGHLPITQRWMTISFEIALHQSIRLRATAMPLDWIDEERQVITWRTKGRNGQVRLVSGRLHDALVPLIRELRAAGAKVTCVMPRMAAKLWWELRQENHLGHTTFHATRVTVITEMARQGVPEQQAMAYSAHSSRLVHRIYQKLKPADLAPVVAKLNFGRPAF